MTDNEESAEEHIPVDPTLAETIHSVLDERNQRRVDKFIQFGTHLLFGAVVAGIVLGSFRMAYIAGQHDIRISSIYYHGQRADDIPVGKILCIRKTADGQILENWTPVGKHMECWSEVLGGLMLDGTNYYCANGTCYYTNGYSSSTSLSNGNGLLQH